METELASDLFLAFPKEEEDNNSFYLGKEAVLMNSVASPWLQYELSNLKVPQFVRFHNEILSFCEYIAPTQSEMQIRASVLDELKEIVASLWPMADMQVFGSQLTEIITPTSDIDIAVLNVPVEGDKNEVYRLNELGDAIRSRRIASYLEVISTAKVPIIKMDHLRTKIALDICINNSSGLDSGRMIRKFMKKYPALRPLTMVLKVFLAQRRLNETYSGGMGSFVLCCTVVSFLQMRRLQEKFHGVPSSGNLGMLLMEYFSLYGGSYNYMHTAITVRGGGRYFRKREGEGVGGGGGSGRDWSSAARPNMLAIENPIEPELDMGRNSFMMPKIRRTMEHALQLLTSVLSDPRIISYLSFVIRPDAADLADRPVPTLSAAGLRQRIISRIDEGEESSSTNSSDEGDEESISEEDSKSDVISKTGGRKRKGTHGKQNKKKRRKEKRENKEDEERSSINRKSSGSRNNERWEGNRDGARATEGYRSVDNRSRSNNHGNSHSTFVTKGPNDDGKYDRKLHRYGR